MISNKIIKILKKIFAANIYIILIFIVSLSVRAEIMEKH